MSYQTYQLDAVVLRAGNVKEANRYYHLLTREFGVIQATAQAVRKEASKLRYSLQELTRAEITLVRGREWRIVGARAPEHWWRIFSNEPLKLRLLARLSTLIVRLSPGESGNEYLYDALISSAEELKSTKDKADLFAHEILLVARFLYSFGYLPLRSEYESFLRDTYCALESLESVTRLKKSLLSDINTALKASHL